MNRKWKPTLQKRSSDQGFALPVAVGMGLIMILVGTTMILRSQDDQVTASAQKATADSLDVSETGVTRVQALLKRFPKMAEKPLSEWPAEYDRLTALNACLSNSGDESIANGDWTNVDNSDLSKGEMKVFNYTHTGNVGTLTVAGRARSESGSETTSPDNATTSLVVQIPILPLDNLPVPGLWATAFDMGNNRVSGNILVSGCSVPAGVSTANIDSGTGTLIANPSVEYPPLPDLPEVCPSGTPATLCYQVFKQDNDPYDPDATPPDAITNTYVKTNGTTITECLKDADGYVVKEDNQGDLVRLKPNITECSDPNHYNESKGVSFPRPNDKPGADSVYRYLLGVDSGNSIALKGSSKIIITAGQKVVFYLQGNIDMSGQAKIEHTGTPPTNFQIFGSDGDTHYREASDTSTYTTTSISLSGNSTANMFIYAPEATVGVNGGGNAVSTITGSVWAKAWDGSSSNQLVITQPTNPPVQWTDLLMDRLRSIGSIQAWQRSQAN